MPENIFVVGLDEMNLEILRDLPDAADYRFHALLTAEEVVSTPEIPLPRLLDRARAQLESFDGSIDAIVGYWDFPVSLMVTMLRAEFGLRGATLEAVLRCEHKYWSRLEQAKVIEEHPRFALVRLDGDPRPPAEVGYPMWVKPVKSASSALAYHVADRADFDTAIREIRARIDRVGAPFDFVLSHVALPPEIAAAGGRSCLAEEAVSGTQVTVEGYSFEGEVHVYGVVDSYYYPDSHSFLRYQYPSTLPESVTDRLTTISERVITQVGLDASTFNIEFFWDAESDRITLLEVNPRHSQSHALLLEWVDGLPNHQCMVRLALGHEPQLPRGEGPHAVAAIWFLRRFTDGVVRRVPTAEEIARVQRDIAGVRVRVDVKEGQRLSDLYGQDSYSYRLLRVYAGAESRRELEEKYRACVARLPFEFA